MTMLPTRCLVILARDQDGTEHWLIVADHPAAMISISDDEMIRIMSTSGTVELVLALLHALGSYVPDRGSVVLRKA